MHLLQRGSGDFAAHGPLTPSLTHVRLSHSHSHVAARAVVLALDPSMDAWRGAAAATAAGFAGAGVAVTRQEYEERGADYLRTKGLVQRYY